MAQVVFLRGVNVGGHRTFRPSLLARQLKALDVVNVGAAGTFVVRNRISPSDLRATFLRRLRFEAEIMICSDREIKDATAADPFAKESLGPDIVRFVSVLARPPRAVPALPLDLPVDKWLVRLLRLQGRFAFGVYRRHMRTIGCLGQIEKVLGMPVTTRNWNTIMSIVKILDG